MEGFLLSAGRRHHGSRSVSGDSGFVWKLLRQMMLDSRPTKTIIHAVLVSISLAVKLSRSELPRVCSVVVKLSLKAS